MKRLDHWHQLWYTCADSPENGYTPNKLTKRDNGAFGGLGGQTFKSQEKLSNSWTDWYQLWFTSADASGNVHRLKTIRPTITKGGILGGFMGSTILRLGNVVKRLARLGLNFAHIMQMNLGMDIS